MKSLEKDFKEMVSNEEFLKTLSDFDFLYL